MTPLQSLLTRMHDTKAALTDRITGHNGEYERIADPRLLKALSQAASDHAASAAWLSEYADWRGGAGCGDHGHEKASKKADKLSRKVRRALGFTNP